MTDLTGRSVLVWGFGRHGGGLAAARHCAAHGARVSILEQRPREDFGAAGAEAAAQGWEWHIGDAGHAAFGRCDLVVASPAIPPRAWPLKHPPRSCPEALFFAAHQGPRIAVTGTKGKSTTATIIATLLGWPVGGNSHEPLLDTLARDGVQSPLVCELSSFQLWYLAEMRPRFQVAVFTSFARDHLDWHPDIEHYRAAKLAVLSWADSCAIAPEMEQIALRCAPRLGKIVLVGGEFRALDGSVIARRTDLPLPGDHNARNACLAISAALKIGVPAAEIAERLRAVRGLPHRLETVHQAGDWRYVNDSIATTPESAIAGMNALTGPLCVILGGSDKGAEFIELAAAAARRGALAVVIGQTAPRISSALSLYGLRPKPAATIEEAVSLARAQLPAGGTILLSPACASFDMFRGFEDRGERFTRAARAITDDAGGTPFAGNHPP
ncbi:MAG: UDP-N-acetylmuramoyl-L-alanine--D-glutamate ligase [Planctomycetes bacterium]|nr:UDP-N-acetylmuramoyl-L-alanine--D-glutamate ligase [Planctomycetota bacterium]